MSDDLTEAGTRRTKLIELFALHRRSIEIEVRVLVPATVVRFIVPAPGPYGPLPAMVEVLCDFKAARPGAAGDIDAAAGETFSPDPGSLTGKGELVGPYPTLTCPVSFPGFGGAWLRGPLVAGEQGRVHFTDRALGRWLVASGLGAPPVDPGEGATHGENLCDAFFVPGLRSGPGTLAGSIPTDGATLGPENGSAALSFKNDTTVDLVTTGPTLTLDAATEIKGGAAAASFAAKADLVMARLDALAAGINAWVPLAGPAIDNGAALKVALAAFLAGSNNVAAVKFKVE